MSLASCIQVAASQRADEDARRERLAASDRAGDEEEKVQVVSLASCIQVASLTEEASAARTAAEEDRAAEEGARAQEKEAAEEDRMEAEAEKGAARAHLARVEAERDRHHQAHTLISHKVF